VVIFYENKGAKCGETCFYKYKDACHSEPWTTKEWRIKCKNGREYVDNEKCTYQDQNGLGGSGLWGDSRGLTVTVNILYLPLVPVEKVHHEATGPSRETQTHHQWNRAKTCTMEL
jgi:hypothetical protein